jgi:cysteine desulfurase
MMPLLDKTPESGYTIFMEENAEETPRRYFDWAATAVPDEREDAAPFGNPSSLHREGRAAREALEEARSRCAAALGVQNSEIFFTSGGTESNAIALFFLACARTADGPGAAFLYSAGEHPSIRENTAALERLGIACAAVGIGRDGRVDAERFAAVLRRHANTRMTAIMAVNNETGAINDMAAIAAAARNGKRPIHLHCDAVQAAGKIYLSSFLPFVDSMSLSAHKLGGPRGAGILYLRAKREALVRGGGQEGGIRPGTENTTGALAMARALERHAAANALKTALKAAQTRMDALLARLGAIPGFTPIPADRTPGDQRFSPWILQAAFRDIPGEVFSRALDEAGFAVSTGSACSRTDKRRPVLEAMGVDQATAFAGIRISQGWSTTMEDIDALAEAAKRLCGTL